MEILDVYRQLHIQNPEMVLAAANLVQCDPAYAAVILLKESYGGANVWGHDRVDTGGYYYYGHEVTQEAYLNYKQHRAELGAQGVGPCQLTSFSLQDQADALGGCWIPEYNCQVGFTYIQSLVDHSNEWHGFLHYNGSVGYANDAMILLQQIRSLLSVVPASLHEGETSFTIGRLQNFLNTHYPLYSHIPLGTNRYGPITAKVIAEFQSRSGISGDGTIVGPQTWQALIKAGFTPLQLLPSMSRKNLRAAADFLV